MARHFPYLSAGITTLAVGAVTSLVGPHHLAAIAWAAQVPMLHPAAVAHPAAVTHPVAAVGGGPSTGTPAAPNLTNTPGTGPAALPPGFQQAAAFGSTGMSQAGEPPYGEMFYSLQTYMNQPGEPDYYDRLGMNPTAIQASEGITPFTSYQGQVGSQVNGTGTTTTNGTATTPPNSIGMQSTPTNAGTTVGFYSGFGPGNPNFGFYAGFTTPR